MYLIAIRVNLGKIGMLQARHEALRKPPRLLLSLSYGRLVGQLKIVHNVLSLSQPWKRGEIIDIS